VHQEAHPDAMYSNYERGRARPLLRGAASRVILAPLPPRTIVKLFEGDPDGFRTANLGHTIEDVKGTLRRIRQAGWESVEGQVTAGATGIAAPIFDGNRHIIGSLSLTMKGTELDPEEINRIASKVSLCAGIITNTVGRKNAV
jgi:DNA-binding IclR family transcriptional regulator